MDKVQVSDNLISVDMETFPDDTLPSINLTIHNINPEADSPEAFAEKMLRRVGGHLRRALRRAAVAANGRRT